MITNWFGWGPGGASSGGGGNTGPNPNPFNETIQEVLATVNYTGGPGGYFVQLEDKNICSDCPGVPFTDYNFSPSVAGFWFYFNVTNNASTWESISNFTLSTSGIDPGLFSPGRLACCFPSYLIPLSQLGFTPGQSIGLAAFVYAHSLPDVGPSGFVLYFNVTSP